MDERGPSTHGVKGANFDEASDLMNATETMTEIESELWEGGNTDTSGLCAYLMGPVGTGGPRTADESSNVESLTVGVTRHDRQLVKYSNPCLLVYLFPMLYHEGQGFYSRNYDVVKAGHCQI